MAKNQGSGDGIAKRSDPDLQRSAVNHGPRGVKGGCVVREPDGLSWRRKKRKLRIRSVENEIKFVGNDLGILGYERQFGIDLSGEQKSYASIASCRQQVKS